MEYKCNNDEQLHELIWGCQSSISDDVFQRWCQGFEFSESEPCALRQHSGGPCSVISSVQAHIFRLLYHGDYSCSSSVIQGNSSSITEPSIILLRVLKEMILLVTEGNKDFYILAYLEESDFENKVENKHSLKHFISLLRYTVVESEEELEALLLSIQPILYSHYGVICFLYSIVLSYGVEELKSAMSDEAVCLIDPMHGHSSQCLTNLLITGHASPYLFDNEKDLGGYVISGIVNQPKIGFLTIMEYLRYCEVGWNLKNPQYPIWVLASETHLTVLCSKDKNVIEKDNNILRKADKNFNKIDTNDQGFIMPEQIEEFLNSMNLPIDDDFVSKLTEAVDPEKLGLFLKSNILRYLYPEEVLSLEASYKFPVIHYNGLEASNKNTGGGGGGVRYSLGEATVEDFSSQTKDYNVNDSQFLKCLRTKWPTITIKWQQDTVEPSLN